MKELATINGAVATTSTITGATAERFINFVDASAKTVETYTRAIRQFIKYLSSKGITEPKREDVIAYREELKKAHKPTTVQGYITAVRMFFQWTAQEGIYANIAEHIKGAKLDKEHKKDYLTTRQIKQVLAAAKARSTRDYAILALMLTGGLRTIEVSRADIADLRAAGNDEVLYIQGKGREEKTDYIKLPAEVIDAIRAYLNERGPALLTDPLFISESNNNAGERLSTRSISGIVKTALRAAGYDSERLTAHSLRHTAVTLALLGGRPIEEVQQFARHQNLQTTLIYAHHLDRAKNMCESTIAEAIFN